MINKKNEIRYNFIVILLGIMLFSGSSILSEFFVVCLITVFGLVLLNGIMERKIKLFSKYGYNKIFIFFIVFLIATLPFTIYLVDSIKYILVFVLMFGISILLIDECNILKKLMAIILNFSIILAISIILSQYIENFCEKVFPYMMPVRESALNMYYSELRNGIYSGLAFERAFAATSLTLGISVIYTKIIQKEIQDKMDFLFLILLFIALFSTGKRMHFLINVFNFVLIFLMNMNKKNLLKGFTFLIPLILALIIILVKIPTAQKVFERLLDFNSYYTIDKRQESFWKYCFEMFEEKPIIGQGINTFKYFIKDKGSTYVYNAHNIFLQVLAETGLFGFLLIISIYVSIFINSIKLLRKNLKNKYLTQITNYAILLQSTFLIYGLSGNTFYYFSQLLFYFVAVIIINNVKYKGEVNEEENINHNVS